MRKLKIKAALCGAACCVLLLGCTAQDGAETASARRANNAASAPRPAATATAPQTSPDGPRRDAHGHIDNARRISVAELHALLTKGEAVPVDVRSPEAYKMAHIKGAILMPSDEIKARAKELPKDKLLVFYCA
jgi:3-mercaptopyruvate sulfurtransferase SseA